MEDEGGSPGAAAAAATAPTSEEENPTSPLIPAKNSTRFKVNFVDADARRESESKDKSDPTADDSTHRSHPSQSTFQYKEFHTLDLNFAPHTAFYRHTNQEAGHARPTMEEIRAGKSRMPKPETPKIKTEQGGVKLGWVQGVLMRCLLNIWGVMLFIRISWVIGQAGIGAGIGVILLSSVVTTLTTISLAAICTNGEVKGGGAYYLISRSLGPEFGGAIGIIFSIANAIAVAMYIVGFAETLVEMLQKEAEWSLTGTAMMDMRIWGILTLLLLFGVSMAGMAWESKAQGFLLFLLIAAMINFVVGTFINTDEKKSTGFYGYNVEIMKYNMVPHFTDGENFFTVFSVFFPAATGIMAGANISGDLKNPSESIPKGTLLAIVLSGFTYCLFAFQAGATTLLSAPGPDNISYTLTFPNLTEAQSCIFNDTQLECNYGLLNSYSVMAMISGYEHIITIGIFAATLSSALASLVSAPKVFQAVCKDNLFPYIGWFAHEYGKDKEPYRAYILALIVAGAFVLIAELNAIAPIITNFFLISYALINYACFEASLSKSPGWRPSYKYYNTWTSLAGTLLCGAVMFVTSWWTALITVAIIYGLYRYIAYTKPAVNWGSSKQALKYNNALSLIHELSGLSYHVKNFRPQFLVLTGAPSSRPRLISFMSDISKGYGVMICGQILHKKYRSAYFNETDWFLANKIKAFHVAVAAQTYREGVRNLLQNNGLGVIKANTLIIGYKHKWQEESEDLVEEYVSIIKDGFDNHYAVGVLRYSGKLDVKGLVEDDLATFQEDDKPAAASAVEQLTEEEQIRDALSRENIADDAVKGGSDTDVKSDVKSGDIEMNAIDDRNDSPSSDTAIDKYRGFGTTKPKGTIDVYWLSDDGGLSILIPYLLSQSHYWRNTTLRVFATGKSGEMKHDRVRMATLLHKFRIEFGSVEIVSGIDMAPSQHSVDAYSELFQATEGDDASSPLNDSKTRQYIRIGELLRENSTEETQLIVVTLPVPRDTTPSRQYMSWLETMSSNLPPILMLRGNQQDALTFYC